MTPDGKYRNRSKKEGGGGIRRIKPGLTIATFPAQMHALDIEAANIYGGKIFDPEVAAPGSARRVEILQRSTPHACIEARSLLVAIRVLATCTNRLILTLALSMATATARADGDPARGKGLFNACAACHSLEPGVHVLGPSLYGVFNRQAGELADYRYSRALKRSGIIWTADTLDAFIADSQQFVPANRMPYSGMPDSTNRADLIAYLQQMLK